MTEGDTKVVDKMFTEAKEIVQTKLQTGKNWNCLIKTKCFLWSKEN